MTIQVIEAPDCLPVTLAEARAWCRIDDSDADNTAVLTQLLGAMTDYAENLTMRAFVQRTLRLTLPAWPGCGYIELAYPPLLGVDSITYLDTANALQTLAADQYEVHDDCEPARIYPAFQANAWPALRYTRNAVRVEFRAGFTPVGSPVDDVAHQAGQPAALKVWIQARLATLFELREQLVVGGQVNKLPHAFADGLLDPLVTGKRIAG